MVIYQLLYPFKYAEFLCCVIILYVYCIVFDVTMSSTEGLLNLTMCIKLCTVYVYSLMQGLGKEKSLQLLLGQRHFVIWVLFHQGVCDLYAT